MLPGVRRQKVEGRRQKASVAFRSCLVCLALCLCAPVALAQDKPYPVYTAEYLDATMKTLGPNMASVRASLADGDFTTAKEQTIRSRGQLATTVTFWRDTEQDEALTLLRTALETDGRARFGAVDRRGRRPGGHDDRDRDRHRV